MSEVSREEMREMRDTGRRAMEKVADVARQAAAQSGISRTFARVSKVNGDGTLQLELGSEAHPMPLYAVRSTTACAAAQPGDTVLLSPACSSFDEFSNMAERGRLFKDLVAGLGQDGE